MDGLAAKVHPHAGPDGGDVPGAQQGNQLIQRRQDLLPGHIDLGVVGPDVIRRLPGVFEVDGVLVHADGEGSDLLLQHDGGNGADQAGVQPAGEEEAQRRVGVQPLVDPGDELIANMLAGGLPVVPAVFAYRGKIGVADEGSPGVVVPRREGTDLLAQAHQVLGLAGEDDASRPVIPVKQGTDADGVPGGDEGIRPPVVEDQGEFRVQPGEHLQAVLPVEGQQNLAVAAALKRVAPLLKLPLQRPEAVDFPVAHQIVPAQPEGLHPLRGQAHDGQPVEAEPPCWGFHNAGHIRPPGFRARKEGMKLLPRDVLFLKTHNRTHNKHLRIDMAFPSGKIKTQLSPEHSGRIAAIRGAT